MPITIYECPMGHVQSTTPGVCIECEGELVPVQYTPVPKEFLTPFEERIQVDENRTVYFLDRHWEGKPREPGIIWELLTGGWWAFVYPDQESLWATKCVDFPKPEQIQAARDAYLKLYALKGFKKIGT